MEKKVILDKEEYDELERISEKYKNIINEVKALIKGNNKIIEINKKVDYHTYEPITTFLIHEDNTSVNISWEILRDRDMLANENIILKQKLADKSDKLGSLERQVEVLNKNQDYYRSEVTKLEDELAKLKPKENKPWWKRIL